MTRPGVRLVVFFKPTFIAGLKQQPSTNQQRAGPQLQPRVLQTYSYRRPLYREIAGLFQSVNTQKRAGKPNSVPPREMPQCSRRPVDNSQRTFKGENQNGIGGGGYGYPPARTQPRVWSLARPRLEGFSVTG